MTGLDLIPHASPDRSLTPHPSPSSGEGSSVPSTPSPARERGTGEVLCGSLLLAGAYALLVPGGRGVALPWPPRVRATVTPAAAWRLEVRDDQGVHEASAAGLAAVAGAVGPLALQLDFGDGPAGGTSALACLALAREQGLAGAARLVRAMALHRALQGGRGSGYDVAASAAGRPLALETGADGLARGRALTPAAGHELVVGVAPKRARTADWIARFDAARGERPRDVARLVDETSAAAGDLAAGLAVAGSLALPEALRRLAGLRSLANALLGHPYGTSLDDALVAAATRLGTVAHPSGAAGDTWLAAHGDRDRLDAVADAWRALGLRVFRASCDAALVLGLKAGDAGQ